MVNGQSLSPRRQDKRRWLAERCRHMWQWLVRRQAGGGDGVPKVDGAPVRKVRILFIKTDAEDREAVRSLDRFGLAIEEGGDWGPAVQMARDSRFDAILIRLSRDTLDGFAAIQRIRAEGQSRHARIVILSPDLRPEERPVALVLGADRIIDGALQPHSLAEAMLADREPAMAREAEALDTLIDLLGSTAVQGLIQELVQDLSVIAARGPAEPPSPGQARALHRSVGSAAILGLADLHAACSAYEVALLRKGTLRNQEIRAARSDFLATLRCSHTRIAALGMQAKRDARPGRAQVGLERTTKRKGILEENPSTGR
jgi:CheY-like chemotaxis protein